MPKRPTNPLQVLEHQHRQRSEGLSAAEGREGTDVEATKMDG